MCHNDKLGRRESMRTLCDRQSDRAKRHDLHLACIAHSFFVFCSLTRLLLWQKEQLISTTTTTTTASIIIRTRPTTGSVSTTLYLQRISTNNNNNTDLGMMKPFVVLNIAYDFSTLSCYGDDHKQVPSLQVLFDLSCSS